MELIIGPRAYSTWSLRGWLVMRMTGADFAVIDAQYDTPEHKAALEALSPSGFVPALRVGGEVIWDTLAIAEWAAETYPEAGLWPTDPVARALAQKNQVIGAARFTNPELRAEVEKAGIQIAPVDFEKNDYAAIPKDVGQGGICGPM